MRAIEAIGGLVLRACAKWPGVSMTIFILALYVLGGYLDGDI